MTINYYDREIPENRVPHSNFKSSLHSVLKGEPGKKSATQPKIQKLIQLM